MIESTEVLKPKRTPRPREQKMINALVSGEAKSLTAAMKLAGFCPSSTSVRDEFLPGRRLRVELEQALVNAGINVPYVLERLKCKIEAKKHVTVAGQAIETDDNDAQLRAIDIGIKLLDRAGKLPAPDESGSGSGHITVNVLVMSEKSES